MMLDALLDIEPSSLHCLDRKAGDPTATLAPVTALIPVSSYSNLTNENDSNKNDNTIGSNSNQTSITTSIAINSTTSNTTSNTTAATSPTLVLSLSTDENNNNDNNSNIDNNRTIDIDNSSSSNSNSNRNNSKRSINDIKHRSVLNNFDRTNYVNSNSGNSSHRQSAHPDSPVRAKSRVRTSVRFMRESNRGMEDVGSTAPSMPEVIE